MSEKPALQVPPEPNVDRTAARRRADARWATRRADADALAELAARTVPLVVVDRDGIVRAWSRGAADLYGREDFEALELPWDAIAGEEDLPDLLRPRADTRRYETVHRTKDGKLVPVMVTRCEMQGDLGGGRMILVADLTDSKALEGRLSRKVAQLSVVREISEALQSPMELHETLRRVLVGATAGQGLRFNRAFLLLVDEDRGELRGRLAIGPSSPEEADLIWSELSKTNPSLRHLLRKHQPVIQPDGIRVNEIVHGLVASLSDADHFLIRSLHAESTVRVVDGHEAGGRPADPGLLEQLGVPSFVAVPLIAEKKPVGLLLADNAITDRPIEDEDVEDLELLGIHAALAIERARLTDERETQVAALEEATRELKENQQRLLQNERLTTIGQMAARVAHEIRNPLVAIGGFARSLLREPPGASCSEALTIIVDEVRRLEAIVREVLDFSKAAPLRREALDLGKIASELLDLMRLEIDDAGVEGRLEVHPDTPPALADRDRIFQALFNLLRNAIHAMPEGGTLTLRTGPAGNHVEIAVEDTGVGMSPDVRSRLFEPFFTTKSAGSGLGLTIAAQIVRDHGGEIDVTSQEGAGTVFRVRLPRPGGGVESCTRSS